MFDSVLGSTGAGKTTVWQYTEYYESLLLTSCSQFINTASGSNLRVGFGLKSCTDNIETSRPFKLGAHTVTLVDTPGFDDTNKSEAEILRIIAFELEKQYVVAASDT